MSKKEIIIKHLTELQKIVDEWIESEFEQVNYKYTKNTNMLYLFKAQLQFFVQFFTELK